MPRTGDPVSSVSFAEVRLTVDFPLTPGELEALTADGERAIRGETVMFNDQ